MITGEPGDGLVEPRDVPEAALVEKGDRLQSEAVTYEVKPTPQGNFRIHRNGRQLGDVLLGEFHVAVATKSQENPRFQITAVGIANDRPMAELRRSQMHPLTITVPFPPTSPSSIVGLPPGAKAVLQRAIDARSTGF